MKKIFILFIICCLLLLNGCGIEGEELKELVIDRLDPHTDFEVLADAEAFAGFPLELDEEIGRFSAVGYRAIEEKLLEASYENGKVTVTVRKSPGEGQDLSRYFGAYEMTESFQRDGGRLKYKYLSDNGLIVTVSHEGYSWCLLAFSGFPGRSCADFLNAVFR